MITQKVSQEELLAENQEAQFYWNKLARLNIMCGVFYPVLCQTKKTIKNANLSPLNACL
ncbi:MAG: hypothetical protein CM1200mP28_02900 [Deltaproteobacteria bacterium]|nr:MAG: hypothetical protein CM1200mP28_02900 [Deltaproteobacteria bacterium]